MRPLLALVLASAVGCASPSSGTSGPSSASTPAPVQSGTPSATSVASPGFVASFDRTWRALPDAYASLGIKVNVIDTATRAVGFAGTVRHKLGTVALSKYFECGTSNGDIVADASDVALVIATQMGRSPEGSMRLMTQLRATANQPQFAHSTAFCTSKGTLEKALYDSLRTRVR
jgi:hypothetical protein